MRLRRKSPERGLKTEVPKIKEEEKTEEKIKEAKEKRRQKAAKWIASEVKKLQKERPIEEVIMKWGKYASKKHREDWIEDMFERVPKILEKEDPERKIGEAKNVLAQRLEGLRASLELEKESTPSQEKVGEIEQKIVEGIEQKISETEEILNILGGKEEIEEIEKPEVEEE